tara:strand:+ start:23 stop:454 length:432 start_codon:yes stop_codon:yes gene_type:complete
MITNYYNKSINEVYEIEKASFKNPWEKSQFSKYSMKSRHSMSCIYSLKTKVIGYLMAESILDEVHIHNIVVKEQHRNNNIGKKMVTHLINQCQEHYKNKICLEVNGSNISALKLYNYLGFRKVGVRKGYYQDGMDAILMDLYI